MWNLQERKRRERFGMLILLIKSVTKSLIFLQYIFLFNAKNINLLNYKEKSNCGDVENENDKSNKTIETRVLFDFFNTLSYTTLVYAFIIMV